MHLNSNYYVSQHVGTCDFISAFFLLYAYVECIAHLSKYRERILHKRSLIRAGLYLRCLEILTSILYSDSVLVLLVYALRVVLLQLD